MSGYVECYDTSSIQLEDKSPLDPIMPILTDSDRFYRIYGALSLDDQVKKNHPSIIV